LVSPVFPKDFRVNKRNRCPICDHDSWCLVHPNGDWVICMRCSNDHPTANGGWFYPQHTEDLQTEHSFQSTTHLENYAPSSDKLLHKAYTSLLCCLEPAWDELRRRGLEYKKCHDIYTIYQGPKVPLEVHEDLQRIISKIVVNNFSIPGVYFDGMVETWFWKPMPDRMLIPVRNHNGHIVGLQCRSVDKLPKYIWYSSAGLDKGCGAIARNCWSFCSQSTNCEQTCRQAYVIVEGPLKSYIVNNCCFASTSIGVPGISLWPRVINKILGNYLISTETISLILAPDMDWIINSYVRKSLLATMDLLKSLGTQYYMAYWEIGIDDNNNIVPKGIDDALLAQEKIRILSPTEYLAKCQ